MDWIIKALNWSLSRALKGPVLLLLLLVLLLLFVSLLRSLLLLLLILLRPSWSVRPRGGPGLGSTPEISNNISTTSLPPGCSVGCTLAG